MRLSRRASYRCFPYKLSPHQPRCCDCSYASGRPTVLGDGRRDLRKAEWNRPRERIRHSPQGRREYLCEAVAVETPRKLGIEDCPYTFFSLVILELPYIGPRGKWVSNQLPPPPDGQSWHAIYWAIPKPRHSPQF